MKKLLSLLLLACAIATFALTPTAWAEGDGAKGAQIFNANCAACHIGGKNVVNPAKTLKKSDLAKSLAGYQDDPLEAIKHQVTMGKAGMPKFLGRLSSQDIEDVATYVLAQSEKGW
jgi:cytochrome c6